MGLLQRLFNKLLLTFQMLILSRDILKIQPNWSSGILSAFIENNLMNIEVFVTFLETKIKYETVKRLKNKKKTKRQILCTPSVTQFIN